MTDEHILLLRELVAWTKVQAMPAVKASLATCLENDDQRRVYQASTGEASPAVAKAAKSSESTVKRVWKKSFRAGLMREDSGKPGRYVRSFDLSDFGLVPASSTGEPDDG